MAERREALAVLVHFRGWKASYDEWITVDAGRLRQLEATSSTVGLAGSSTLWQPSRAALDSTPAPPATVPSASQLRVSPSPPPLPLALGSEADSRRACTSTGERHVHPHAHGEGKRARNGKASVKACLLQHLTCSICCDVFSDPHFLSSCGHTFCRDCLEGYLRGRGDRQCPRCRAPAKWRDVVRNHDLAGVVESLHTC